MLLLQTLPPPLPIKRKLQRCGAERIEISKFIADRQIFVKYLVRCPVFRTFSIFPMKHFHFWSHAFRASKSLFAKTLVTLLRAIHRMQYAGMAELKNTFIEYLNGQESEIIHDAINLHLRNWNGVSHTHRERSSAGVMGSWLLFNMLRYLHRGT